MGRMTGRQCWKDEKLFGGLLKLLLLMRVRLKRSQAKWGLLEFLIRVLANNFACFIAQLN